MGQGKGHLAEKVIDEAVINGGWVMLEDCYLCPSWFSQL